MAIPMLNHRNKFMEYKRRVRLRTAMTVLKALLARCFFIVHMIFAIVAASCVAGSTAVWSLMSLFVIFIMETIYSIAMRQGQEPKWFSPCIFLYLLTILPPIWILNLDTFHCFVSAQLLGNRSCVGLTSHAHSCSLVSIDQFFDRKPLAYTMEEVMLLLLIMGRWMLPKGTVSRDQLSQLLFVYFNISFDMMELFYLFDEPGILRSETMNYVVLTIWSLSLFQFTIVLTAVKSRRPRISLEAMPLRRLTSHKCCQFEIWSLLTTVVMHEGPFLILRLYCLLVMQLFSYNLLFYTIKNFLFFTLQTYRFVVLVLDCRRGFSTKVNTATSTTSSIMGTSGPHTCSSATPTKVDLPSTDRSSSSNMSIGASSFYTLSYNNQDFSFESTV